MSRADSQRGATAVGRIFLLCLIGVGGYGGYYGYSRYKAGEKLQAFGTEALRLRQTLLSSTSEGSTGPEQVRAAVSGFAARSGVTLDPETIQIIIEPLGPANAAKLPQAARTAFAIAAKLPRHTTPPWLVGFRASVTARHGPATVRAEHERYTYLESARAR